MDLCGVLVAEVPVRERGVQADHSVRRALTPCDEVDHVDTSRVRQLIEAARQRNEDARVAEFVEVAPRQSRRDGFPGLEDRRQAA